MTLVSDRASAHASNGPGHGARTSDVRSPSPWFTRLARLTAPERDVLLADALLGGADVVPLHEVLGTTPEAVERALTSAQRLGLLRLRPVAGEPLTLPHVTELLLASSTQSQKLAMYALVVRSLRRCAGRSRASGRHAAGDPAAGAPGDLPGVLPSDRTAPAGARRVHPVGTGATRRRSAGARAETAVDPAAARGVLTSLLRTIDEHPGTLRPTAGQVESVFAGTSAAGQPEGPGAVVLPLRAPRLTERQQRVLAAVADGAVNDGIARALHVSTATVRRETTAIYRALGVTGRAEAVAEAFRRGLLQRR